MEHPAHPHPDGPPRKGIPLRLTKRALRLGLPLVVLLFVAAPGTAWAADSVTYAAGDPLAAFIDDPGEGSNLTIDLNQGSVVFTANDGDPITAPADCAQTSATKVTCTNSAIGDFFATMNDGNDTVVANGNRGGTTSGGVGEDNLTGSNENEEFEQLFGDSENDQLNTRNVGPPIAPSTSVQDGAYGDEGNDSVTSGNGDDDLRGGGGTDNVSSGPGDDFAAGDEGDNDRVDLGPGDDSTEEGSGSGTGDSVVGGEGVDELTLFNSSPAPTSPDDFSVDMSTGSTWQKTNNGPTSGTMSEVEDVLTSRGNDAVVGSDFANSLFTGGGDDSVNPRAGADFLLLDDGNDFADTRDGFGDRVVCGNGTDSVQVDQLDVTSGCESVAVSNIGPAGPDKTAPNCVLARSRTNFTTTQFFRGFTIQANCNEPVQIDSQVLAQVRTVSKRGRLITSRVGELILAEHATRLGPASQRIRLRPSRRLGRRLGKRFRARVVISARDQFGNRRIVRKTLRVKAKAKKKKKKRRRARRR